LGFNQTPDANAIAAMTQTVDQPTLNLLNTVGGGNLNQPLLRAEAPTNTSLFWAARVTGDSISRFVARPDGQLTWGDGTAGRDTNLFRSAADVLATDDDFAINLAGKGLKVKEGSNAKMGTVTLVAGSATVNTTAVTANSRIFLDAQTAGAGPGALRVSSRTPGTSFGITSTSGSDTAVVAWMIVEPA
jgi:hypothetical protein